jgi:hypothetical protein
MPMLRAPLRFAVLALSLFALSPPAATAALSRGDRNHVVRALAGLPQADVRLVLSALGRLPDARAHRATVQLSGLARAQRRDLIDALELGLGPLPAAGRRALVNALVGVATPSELRTVAGAAANALRRVLALLKALVPRVDRGDAQFAAFLDRVLRMMTPHLRALLARGLSRLPAGTRPLVLALDREGIAQGSPAYVLADTLMLQDPATARFVQQAGSQAGSDCASNGCSTFDLEVIYVSGIPVAPALIQQDIVDCLLTPLCTRPEQHGLAGYIDQLYQESKINYQQRKELIDRIRAENVSAQESWIGTFAY